MNVTTRLHTDGKTVVITYLAETRQDYEANAALFGRYDGTGLIGSAASDGSRLELIVVPLTPQEIEEQRWADGFIACLNEGATGQRNRGALTTGDSAHLN